MDEERGSPVPDSEAVRLGRELYGLEAAARPLPGEYDDNFHLICRDGRAFVLKVLHMQRERGLVDMQCAALQHLATRAPQLALPRVVPTRTGEPVANIAGPGERARLVFMLGYVPGIPLAEAHPRSSELLSGLGKMLGRIDGALLDFTHAAARRELKWDLARAGWIRGSLDAVVGADRRALVEHFLDLYTAEVAPVLGRLRRSVIHGDANDWNVLVAPHHAKPSTVVSVIDFGDMHEGLLVAEPAVAAAYALLGQADPLRAAAAVIGGYHSTCPLGDDEIAVLFPLIGARLAVSVTNSALRHRQRPDDPYVTVTQEDAFAALARLAHVSPRLALALFRSACERPPVPEAEDALAWLKAHGHEAAGVLDSDLRHGKSLVLDLGVSSLFLGADPGNAAAGPLTAAISAALTNAKAPVAVGRYDEARVLYASPLFAGSDAPGDERRTVHLGIDLFVPPGSALRAPFDGIVHLLANNQAAQDYGPLVVLRHELDANGAFFTLYGHLSEDTLGALAVGQPIARGEAFARVGAPPGNGNWPPHVHFQVIVDLLGLGADFPGVCRSSERETWKALSPDPNLVLGIPASLFPAPEPTREDTLRARRERLGNNLSLSYERPMKIVRGFMQHLYDETGRAYLDVYNNVPLVGHSHPRVVRAAQAQLALLNTNTRYLHDNVLRYAEQLTRRLPHPLHVCFFLNSGSEANELALRLARARTGSDDVIVLEHAYHGHTQTLVDVSPYKFEGPGGRGRRDFVHVAPLPDDYRGAYRRGDPQAGPKYAHHVGEIVERVRVSGRRVGAYLAETLPSVGGQIVLPPGYLADAYRHVRAAGGVCIADEVQVGFGRLGTHFWGFETQGVVPDVVVLGKPIGNGFPLAAVVTTMEIAAAFDNGMEFFSTFGGNPVAAAAGLAVLDVLEEEGLQERARQVGAHFLAGLRELAARHPLVGDARGSGLFLGLELVRDRGTLEPATEEAAYVVNRLRERGILTGTDGPHDNVLKLRPPLVFSESDAEQVVKAMDEILAEDALSHIRSRG